MAMLLVPQFLVCMSRLFDLSTQFFDTELGVVCLVLSVLFFPFLKWIFVPAGHPRCCSKLLQESAVQRSGIVT